MDKVAFFSYRPIYGRVGLATVARPESTHYLRTDLRRIALQVPVDDASAQSRNQPEEHLLSLSQPRGVHRRQGSNYRLPSLLVEAPVLLQDDLGITTDLYTVQGYNLLEFRGEIHLTQYVPTDAGRDDGTTPALRDARDGSGYLVLPRPTRPGRRGGRFLHVVRVDARDVIAVVDTFAWNHIIGNKRYIPEDDHDKLKYDAAMNSDSDYLEALQAAEDEYLRNTSPPTRGASYSSRRSTTATSKC